MSETTRKSKSFKRNPPELESAVVEIRYPNAYRIWDNAGSIWEQLVEVHPNLTLVDAEPRRTVFTLNSQFEIQVEINKTVIKGFSPKSNLSDFLEIVGSVIGVVTRKLKVAEIDRVGFRLMWTYEHASIDSATESLLSLELLNVPKQDFGIRDAKVDRPDVRIRWENDRLGVLIQIRAEKRETKVTAPIHLAKEIPTIEKETYVVVFDSDYYTLGTISVGQFNSSDWVSQAYHAIKQSSKTMMTKLEEY